MKKIWISESQFIELGEDGESLSSELAIRSRSLDWFGFFGYLPDPDEVLRKLGQDVTVYRKLLTDSHLWTCYQSRKSAVLSCEWHVKESEQGSIRGNRRAYKLIEDLFNDLDVYQVITDMLEAPFFGMSPIEVIWKKAGAAWLPARIEGKPPEWFVFDQENELRFLSRENMTEGEEIPENKFLLPRHHASYQNPYGERILARCFWPVAFKKGGFKFWAIFTERFGMPWVIGKVPPRTNDTERSRVLADLRQMVQDAVAVINNDESITIEESKSKTGSADIYEHLIEVSNREMSKAVLGQTATTEGTPGKLGEEKGQNETKEDIVDSDKRMVENAFNTLFRWITALNFADADAPRFAFHEEEDIQKDRAERDKTLNEQGVRFTPEYYQRAYNLQEGDFEIVEPASRTEEEPGRTFAEKRPDNRLSPDDADQLSDDGSKAATEAMSALLAPVLKVIDGAKSFEEIGEKIYELYPDLDTREFQDLLARAMFVSSLTGYALGEKEAGKK